MKTIACIIARTSSRRLPKKVLHKVQGITILEYIIRKIKRSRLTDGVYVCTSYDQSDAVILDLAKANGVKAYAGDPDSVIDRMLDVARIENAHNLVRITGDNIFTDEVYLDLMLKYHKRNAADYTRTEYLPLGMTAEVMRVEALKECYKSIDPNFSQYLLIYIFQPERFKCQVLVPQKNHQHPEWSLTVDTSGDLDKIAKIIGRSKDLLSYEDIIDICSSNSISGLDYGQETNIKFPAGVLVTYGAFKAEMKARISKSIKVYLKETEYEEIFDAQKV